jgi:hypothetical protein
VLLFLMQEVLLLQVMMKVLLQRLHFLPTHGHVGSAHQPPDACVLQDRVHHLPWHHPAVPVLTEAPM